MTTTEISETKDWLKHQEHLIMVNLDRLQTSNDDKSLMAGLLNHAHEDKYRTIKKKNTIIQEKLLSLKTVHDFIQSVGFEDIDEEKFEFKGDHYVLVMFGQAQVFHVLEKIKFNYMNQEDKARYLELKQNTETNKKVMHERNEHIQELKKQMEFDRKDRDVQL
ncbi:UNKNOWN [Stylonychia lemnae]|uniref:PUB domain-containing protein n=1 Tax=Stylonychia lemnae TaxID=5949 RepID=A0A078AIM8_STYLE|nr:UNKNOWN [Stylonychia lemnae]|eukprot:CDW81342.1 UNKNOWN [Stylonychia lemnae]